MTNPLVLISSAVADGQKAKAAQARDEAPASVRPGLVSSLNHRLLCLMAEEGGISCPQAAARLSHRQQTVRNALCKLVRQEKASVTLVKARNGFAMYTITPKGCAMLDATGAAAELDDEAEAEQQRKDDASRRARMELNLARARHAVPRSVFDLGRCVAASGARA